MDHDELGRRLAEHPATADLDLVVLHGSRARGDAVPDSDWDLGVLAADHRRPDLAGLGAAIVQALGTERVDVVDLRVASALLRYRAARDGVVLLEREEHAFSRFRTAAVLFWCDAGPVIRAAQDTVLARL